MALACVRIFVMLVLLPLLADLGLSSAENGGSGVKRACRVTRYRELCVRSLVPYASTAGQSPSKWARAGVSVALREATDLTLFVRKLKKHRPMRGRNQVALLDCIESFQDAVDNLHKSLGILRKLDGRTLGEELSNLNTWVSAAVTDEDTCLDGLAEQNKQLLKRVRHRVLTVTYITSNALALISKLGAPASSNGTSTDP